MGNHRIIDRLLTDHARLWQVFAVLEHQMELLSTDGDGPDYRLLEDVVEYLIDYPDSIHHPLEDRLFEAVLAKQVDADMEILILMNRDQHVEINAGTRNLRTAIQHILVGSVVPSAQLKGLVAAYIDLQRKHLLVEERQLFPLAEATLQAQDWQALEAAYEAAQDPVFEQTLDQYAELHRYIVEMGAAPEGQRPLPQIV